MLSIDRASQRERAAAAALRLLPKTLTKEITEATKAKVVPLAVAAAMRNADTPVMRAIAASGKYSVWRGIPGVAFGGTKAVTSSGVAGRVIVRGLEYGAKGRRETIFRRATPSGGSVLTARRTTRQFMPDRSSNPTAIYPAMEAIADDVLAIWVEVVEDAMVRAFNGEKG